MLVFESTCSVPGWCHAGSEDSSGMLSCASSQQYELSGLSSWHANRPCRGVSLRKHSSSEKRQVAHLVKAIRARNVQRKKHLTVSLLGAIAKNVVPLSQRHEQELEQFESNSKGGE